MQILVLLLTIITTPVAILWRGFVVSKLWAWHVVTVFGLPALTVLQAVSVSLIVAVLTARTETPDTSEWTADKKLSKSVEALILPFTVNGFFLFSGWAIHVCQ